MPRRKHDTTGSARNHRAMRSGRGHRQKSRTKRTYAQPMWRQDWTPAEHAIAAVNNADRLTALFTGRG